MSLTSISFIGVYFPLLLTAFYNPIFTKNQFQKFILLSASIGFYAFVEPFYVFLLIGIILMNYLLVKASDHSGRWFFRGLAIAFDAGILLFYKYINYFLSFGQLQTGFQSIAFPVGLSYYSFKSISYVVDSRYEKEGSLLDVALYISNFLTIVSGPLSMYEDELHAIRKKKTFSFDTAYKGIEKIIIGLGKKVIIADNLGKLANCCFLSGELSVVMAWAGAIAFSLQLLFDFSGYTDMAVGTGSLFGFELPENFNYPYMATSISDFWKRWHISLTKWFTKYIYIPLGGSRVKSVSRHLFNLFAVWLVTGVWHGSSMTFIVWAMIYFVLQALEKYTSLKRLISKIHLGHIYTMLVVILEWVIFRSESLSAAFLYIRSMFACNGNALYSLDELNTIQRFLVPLILAAVFSTFFGLKLKAFFKKNNSRQFFYNTGLLIMFVVCIIMIISQGYSAPLYAEF